MRKERVAATKALHHLTQDTLEAVQVQAEDALFSPHHPVFHSYSSLVGQHSR